MKSNLKNISYFLVISTFINVISHLLNTDYLLVYLLTNLLTLQITLMAINTATSGLIVSKLQEIKNKLPHLDIKPITNSLLSALKEQIILIIVGVILMIINKSEITVTMMYSNYFDFFIETLIITVFVYSIDVLWDTGKAIFVLVDIMDDNNH